MNHGLKVLESVLYAENLDAAHEFYTGVLGLKEISFDPSRHLFMDCLDSVLIIFKASKTVVADAGVPTHGTTGHGHLAFGATEDEIVEWKSKLAQAEVEIIQEVQWENGATSIYFKDPAGNILEFASWNLWNL